RTLPRLYSPPGPLSRPRMPARHREAGCAAPSRRESAPVMALSSKTRVGAFKVYGAYHLNRPLYSLLAQFHPGHTGTAWRLGVSGRNRCLRERIVGGLESLSEAGAERAIIDGAANLKQKIRTWRRPAHLLPFVLPAVHQKIGRPFGDRGAGRQSGTVPLGVVDQPVALSGEITIQCVQGGPQLSRRRNRPPLPLFPLKMMHHCADTIDAATKMASAWMWGHAGTGFGSRVTW